MVNKRRKIDVCMDVTVFYQL